MFKGRERPFKMSGSIRSENIHSTTLDNGEISEEKQPHHNSLVLGVKSISLRALCHMTEPFHPGTTLLKPSLLHTLELIISVGGGGKKRRKKVWVSPAMIKLILVVGVESPLKNSV